MLIDLVSNRRVHISWATRQLLGDDYEYEPGYGIVQDDYLASAGVATYLVVAPPAEELENHPLDHVQPRATVVRKPSALKKRKADADGVVIEEEEEDSDEDNLYVSLPGPMWTDSISNETEQVDDADRSDKATTLSHVYKVIRLFHSPDPVIIAGVVLFWIDRGCLK